MSHPVRSKIAFGVTMLAMLGLTTLLAAAQVPNLPPATAAGSGSDIIRIRKMTPITEKTPVFRTAAPGQASARQPDWWRVMVEYETAPDWIDELEFTYYVYMKDQSNKGAEVMFSATVSYVNVAKGRHVSDMFLQPNVLTRLGRVEQVAVVVKAKGAVVATESTAKTPNWWDRFSPVSGVLLNRSQTPFAYIDYDLYEAIKPATAAR
jgi:hypothetical protein